MIGAASPSCQGNSCRIPIEQRRAASTAKASQEERRRGGRGRRYADGWTHVPLLAPRGTRGGVRERARIASASCVDKRSRFTPTLSLQRPPAAGARAGSPTASIPVPPIPPLLPSSCDGFGSGGCPTSTTPASPSRADRRSSDVDADAAG